MYKRIALDNLVTRCEKSFSPIIESWNRKRWGKKRRNVYEMGGKKRERERGTNHRFKRRRTAIGERIVSLFQRARLKALCASIETHCVYRTEETGTATRAITKKPLQHTT